MSDNHKFADLRRPKRVWAIGAIHGEAARLAAIHDEIGRRFEPGDRLVYLGNMIGHGEAVVATMDELLAFRRALIALPGLFAEDVVYLRGAQEEMWQKLLQIQLAPNPTDVLSWMLRQGLEATLAAYGGSAEQGMRACREGAVALTRWTGTLRAAIRAHPGHDNILSALRRAAFTSGPTENGRRPAGLLLVHAGIDPSRPFDAQGDIFWWGGAGFSRIDRPYAPFHCVVRGYDAAHAGIAVTEFTATIDGGCGFGGRLACACLNPDGGILEIMEA